MKTKYFAAAAIVALVGVAAPSSAWYGPLENPRILQPGPGEMRAVGGLGINFISGGFFRRQFESSLAEELFVRYDFIFRLAEDSDGIYPAAEVVEVEIPGELNPDGTESSSFVISIPMGSFREGPSGFFYTFNPSGLKVNQHYESYDWDFVGSDGVQIYSGGVTLFWCSIRQRDADEVADLSIRMRIMDNRLDNGAAEPAPKIVELLFGSPTLSIGNDGWETRVYNARDFLAGPYSPPE